ncbi:hypothetical protein ACFVXA_35300 [Streptomyces sp. NPDC058246]|uniref:hypothetical protein n=1 Tax=Streptomyces sp. NPDC058246 TaxID=3346400 RepID=UPI0036E4343F
MSDQNGQPQHPDPRAWDTPEQPHQVPSARSASTTAVPYVPQGPHVQQVQQVQQVQVQQVLQSDRVWVDGYEPGNPWQSRLCMQTPYGTVAHPLTPHTMPELLEQLVLVAQEQQGLPAGIDEDDEPAADHGEPDEDRQSAGARLQGGRAARMTGWAVVHDLWEREDPTARMVMGAVVVGLLLLGIFLT